MISVGHHSNLVSVCCGVNTYFAEGFLQVPLLNKEGVVVTDNQPVKRGRGHSKIKKLG